MCNAFFLQLRNTRYIELILNAHILQLYGEVSEDNERSEAEIDNIDYDSEYSDDDDDDNSASHDYHSLTTTPASKSSDLAKNTSTSASTSESNKTISGVLTSVRKAQTDRREELEKYVREYYKPANDLLLSTVD